MIFGHRRRHNERTRSIHMGGIVRTDRDAEVTEVGGVTGIGIAPGDLHAASHEQFGESAHAGAGNADKMNGPLIGGIQERHQRGNIARTINSSRR